MAVFLEGQPAVWVGGCGFATDAGSGVRQVHEAGARGRGPARRGWGEARAGTDEDQVSILRMEPPRSAVCGVEWALRFSAPFSVGIRGIQLGSPQTCLGHAVSPLPAPGQ